MQSLIDKKALIEQSVGYLFEEALLDEMLQQARLRETVTDETIIHVGDTLHMIPIVVQGAIKVSRENPDGEELLLYYIEGGDTCAMSLQCCIRKTASHIKATSMEPSVLLMFPMENMQEWMDRFPSWRAYILQSYHTRMLELMETIDEIAFMRLDERLLKYLKDQVKLLGSEELHHTHQQIADDLHSSRVVISRLLKQLEHRGIVEIHRNRIKVKDY
ncbi:MAG: Crp/Fnr family transcriptional regulator [Flavobacteriia bacterium]|jgi:CRP/FNR family transcriptional regulator|nr:Crp/Fnr family transcriptional regulator [Flavobacteriia bacterium]NBP29483.1 Crp/Fnr family transcriptional regulator [Flavobacteriia bacterium]